MKNHAQEIPKGFTFGDLESGEGKSEQTRSNFLTKYCKTLYFSCIL